mgnify:CR=1 FL=1
MAFPAPVYADNFSKKIQVEFGGYNHRRAAGDGEWFDMRNLTSADAPLLAVRRPRHIVRTLNQPNGLCGGNALAWVDGSGFYYDGTLRGTVSNGRKRMVVMGHLLLIFPDKKFHNINTQEFGSLEAHYSPGAGKITFRNGMYMGESADANTLETSGAAFSGFSVGDAVTISGCTTHPENNLTIVIREISADGKKLIFYPDSFVLGGAASYTEAGSVRIDRNVPDLDIVFVHENRLWGAKDNTIYASALADPFNFNNFDLTGLESWQLDVLSAGSFTGGCSYLGYPCFFKSEQVFKIYGSVPSDFKSVPSANLGVAVGSGDSLAIAGEKLFYLSRAGVVLYSGGLPSPISQAFGDVTYSEGVGGTDGLLYYISMRDSGGNWSMFVYDTLRGMWHRHDELHALFFAWCGEGLFVLDADGRILFIGDADDAPPGSTEESSLTWFAESADFTESSPQRKWLLGIDIRAELAAGARFSVKVIYDGGPEWHTAASFSGAGKRSFIVPRIPRRADHYRIRLEGSGRVWIYSLAPNTEQGSEYH